MFGTRQARAVLLTVGCLLICGCDKPNKKPALLEPGKFTSQRVDVQAFEALVVPGRTRVKVSPGVTGQALLKGPDNYLKLIEFRSESRQIEGQAVPVLVVDLPHRLHKPLPEIELQTPLLKFVETKGPARVALGDFSNSLRSVSVEGASSVRFAPGVYGKLKFRTSGGGRIKARKARIESVEAEAEGISRIFLGEVASLKKKESGSARVAYTGTPELK